MIARKAVRVRLFERTFNGNSLHVMVGSLSLSVSSSRLCLSRHRNRSVFTGTHNERGLLPTFPSVYYTSH